MIITINDRTIEASCDETLIETAERAGFSIPSLCYAKGFEHRSSCMICAVKIRNGGQIVPSCATKPEEGMQIDTESDEVKSIRRLSSELLLSDHRADCEAPCTTVCPQGADVERILKYYDAGKFRDAFTLIEKSFRLPDLECDNCKAPCEKICRRGSIDKSVAVRRIVKETASMFELSSENAKNEPLQRNKIAFQSHLGRFTEEEKRYLKKSVSSPSGCLHCACAGKDKCKLRSCAALFGIKRTRYNLSSVLPVGKKISVTDKMRFEPAKCIRCGLCVYNGRDGFTFTNRGFGMQVIIPEESRNNVDDNLTELCPTGALYSVDNS